MSRGDLTRRLIIDAAEAEFLDTGFSGTRIESIAARAHVGVGTVYLHYANKEALYAAVLLRAEEMLLDDYLGPIFLLDAPPWERIRAWCRGYVRFVLEQRGRARLLTTTEWWEAARPPELDHALRERIRAQDAELLAIFKEAAAHGELLGTAPSNAHRFVWAAMYGACALQLRHPDLELSADELLRFVDDGLTLLSGGRARPAGQMDA